MPARAPGRALSVVLLLLCAPPPAARACPRPCACYVPSEVHCTFRSLASVPAGISKHVERINLGFNSIQALSDASFAGLGQLQLLMLHGNNIPSIPDGALRDLGALQVFKFSYNKLRVLTARTLQGLRSLLRLHVDHNEIEFVHPHAFRGLAALRLLHLEGNRLHQLHPATFCTFSLLDHFQLSTVRHLYLADNRLQSLPAGTLESMPLLENLYLHGNPWACDCRMRWLLEGRGRAAGLLKCKKDKAFEGGQLCAACASPRTLRGREIHRLQDVPCVRPSISSPLRHNGSSGLEDEQGPEDGGDGQLSPERLRGPAWRVSLNMSDEHGNTVSLACDTQKPTHLSQVRVNQTEAQDIDVDATVGLDLECPMTRENYEKLWKLIAYYSEVPVRLQREAAPGREPAGGVPYRQHADADALYYTGVRAQVLAEPQWVTQPSIQLQLDRRRSTASKVWLTYSAQLAWTSSSADAGRARGRSWVMVEPGPAGRQALAVLDGAPCQLSCNVKASESPAISWVLPDGSVLTAPTEDRDGRLSILTSGWLKIASARLSDSGLYQCVARVRDETDRIVYRVLVQPPVARPPDGQTVTIQQDAGQALTLPCSARAAPEAQVSWVLPGGRMVGDWANASHAHVLADGTLSIPEVQPGDSGYYRCVAVNELGADGFTVGVSVRKTGPGRSPKRGRRPGGKAASRPRDVVEDEGGSGDDGPSTSARQLHPKDQETLVTAKEEAGAGGKKAKKGRRKPKGWKTPAKDAEANVAEGRRVFESRRKINMANKQITPERWADILARVRGKTPPRGTGSPDITAPATPPSPGPGATPARPAVPPPSVAPVQTTASAEESSADASLFGEEEQLFSPVPTTRLGPGPGQHRVILAGAKATSGDPEKVIDDEFPEKTEAAATTRESVPRASYSALSTVATAEEGPTAGAEGGSLPGAGSSPVSASRGDASPLDRGSSAESEAGRPVHGDSGLKSPPHEDETKGPSPRHLTPTPTSLAVDSETLEPLEEVTLEDPQVPAETHLREQTDNLRLEKNGVRTQDNAPMTKDTEDDSPGLWEGGEPDTEAARSRRPETEGPGITSTASTDSSRPAKSSVLGPRDATLGPPVDKDSATVGVRMPAAKTLSRPTTQPPRRRPHGRRKSRPHKSRQQDPQTPPTVSAPAEATPARPTAARGVMVTDRAGSSPPPTSGLESTAGPRRRLDADRHAGPSGRATPRRKPGRRPHRLRLATAGPAADGATAPAAEATPPSTTLPLRTGAPRQGGGVEGDTTTSSERHSSPATLRGTPAAAEDPVSRARGIENDGATNIRDDETGRAAAGADSVMDVPSPPGSTVGAFKEESGVLESNSWVTPGTAQPGTLKTGTAVPASAGPGAGPSPFTELDDPNPASKAPPSAAAPAPLQQEGRAAAAATAASSTDVESPSSQAGTATRRRGHGETGAAATRPEISPQSPALRPATHATLRPALRPTTRPATHATLRPSVRPTVRPTTHATLRPTMHFTVRPSVRPTTHATLRPAVPPNTHATLRPDEPPTTLRPDAPPTTHFTVRPSVPPTTHATPRPGAPLTTLRPTMHFTVRPSVHPTTHATLRPAAPPTTHATLRPAVRLTTRATLRPDAPPTTLRPTMHFTVRPTVRPSVRPTTHATLRPAAPPTTHTTLRPAAPPTTHATLRPTVRLTAPPITRATLRPAVTEQPASPFPHSALVSVARGPTKPTPLTSATPAGSREDVFFNHVAIPRTQTPPGSYERTPPARRPPEPSSPSPRLDTLNVTPKTEPGKEASDGGTTSALARGPHPQHETGRVQTVPHAAGVPGQAVPPRGTARPPHTTTRHSSRHAVTFQPPRHLTNKPQMTAQPSRVWPERNHWTPPKFPSTATAPGPWPGSRAGAPTAVPDRGTERAQGPSRASGSHGLPELPRAGGHRSPDGRPPFVFNRTFSFPRWAVTPKPPPATAPAPGTRQRTVPAGPYNRIHSQSVLHGDLGPPAPPAMQRPQVTTPPSARAHNGPLLYATRSPSPFATSSGQSSGSFHQSSSKFFSAGGPPASKFWTLGEKPQIVTKSPQTVLVAADTDVVLPCEATGKPKPFITWTKVSTGAAGTPDSRAQRFEVLANGSLVIRRAQAQDGGRYLCTAENAHGADRALVQLSVAPQQPRAAAGHYQDVTVSLGDTIAMECLAKGTPAPHISWIFPDGRVWQAASPAQGRVALHENRTLSIRDASFADSGVYKCVASNAAGADSLAIRLHVTALPPVIQQDKLENISLPPGLSVHVHCSAKAAPRPSVRWVLADGTHVRPSQFVHGNLFVFPNGTLYIRSLAPEDSGRYECVAANLVGAARRTVQLSVQRAAAHARITASSPRRTDVRYGATLRLDCRAAGDPGPRILWRLPSKRVIDALFSFDPRVRAFANGTLVVTSVTDKDAGDYLCVARNPVGDDFVAMQVHVVMKPAKIEHREEQDHRVSYGADLRVDCVASGLPDPEIAWGLPDGSLVHSFVQSDDGGGGRGQRYVVFNNGTLYFNEVGMREAGDYTCFAKNQAGRDEMTVHVKVVAEPAAIRDKAHAAVHVPYGGMATVTCGAQGEPAPRVTWLSPTNKPIPASSDKYRVHEDGTLLIRKAQRADSGNYTCVVRNRAGEDRKVVWVHVTVQPPTINGSPNAITTVREVAAGGSRKLIDCLAEGVPPPRVLWAFPEGVVLPAPYYGHRVTVHRNGTLDIRSLRKSDSVQLACIGRNEGGEARLIVQLTVLEPLEKPFFHDPVTEKITATAGHTISLNCSAAGSPPPSLHWVLPNGTELARGQQLRRVHHQSDGRLHVSGLLPADAGAYRCVARNAAGHSERLVSLRVGLRKAPAGGPQHSVVSILNGETLRLPCPAPPGRPARASWTLPSGVALRGPQARGRVSVWDNGTLTVREASVFDRGTYVCQTDAEPGPSTVSYAVIVIAYPPRITSEPTPVIYARPGQPVTMKCMAVGVPKAEISWELPDRSQLTAGPQARLYGHRRLQPQGTLTLQPAARGDAGFYRCTARNVLGSDSRATYVHVY